MKHYLISYDLINETDNELIEEEIKSFDKFCKVNDTAWIIKVSDFANAKSIRGKLLKRMGSGDRIFVVRIGLDLAYKNPVNIESLLKFCEKDACS